MTAMIILWIILGAIGFITLGFTAIILLVKRGNYRK